MATERWQQIEELYHAALEHAPERRAAFLGEACADDADLRREVESLLRHDDEAETFMLHHAVVAVAQQLDSEDLQTTQTLLMGQQLGAYKILAPLGKGGMGEVYLALDTRLERKVALKLLPRDVAANKERMRRFVREAKAASALNHPHVATIYEIGEANSIRFIAMEYVEGQTLAAKTNGQPLAINELIEIGSQMADALDEAHTKGITHRDIKPANVMLTARDQVKVLDFGLAKIARPPSIDSNISTLAKTASGVVMGTVPYMSPEQALGRDIDHRSDIFSLGVVLYEMATGRLPFVGANAVETLDRILHAEPESIAQFNTDAPAELERIVRKCLAKDREARYQSVRELLVDLENQRRDSRVGTAATKPTTTPRLSRRWPLVAFAAALLALGGLALYLFLSRAQPKAVAINSMVVLPFKPLVAESHDEALELGMADTLITRLSGIRQLIVRPVSAVRKYTSAEQNAIAAGKEQQVDAVLESHFQRSGDRIRVTVQLIRVGDGSTVWAGKFDEQSADLFAVQDGISEQVARALATQLTAEEQKRLAKHDTENKEAYLLYQKGRFYWNKRTAESLKKSIEYFNQALEKDQAYALAHVGLADAYLRLPHYGVGSPQDIYPKAKAAAKRAIALDDTLAEAHVSLAQALYFNDWNLPESDLEFQKAIALNPNYATAHESYGLWNLAHTGRFDEAFAHLKRAQDLDPLSLIINSDIGTFYVQTGQYDKASEQLLKTLELDQNFYSARRWLGRAYELKGFPQEALAEYQKAYQLNDDPLLLAAIGHVHASSGKKAEALRKLNQLKEISRQRYVSAYNFAIIHAGLGDKDQVMQWLERGYQEHIQDMLRLKFDPYFANLRSDPRFADLVRRVGGTP